MGKGIRRERGERETGIKGTWEREFEGNVGIEKRQCGKGNSKGMEGEKDNANRGKSDIARRPKHVDSACLNK